MLELLGITESEIQTIMSDFKLELLKEQADNSDQSETLIDPTNDLNTTSTEQPTPEAKQEEQPNI